MAVGIRRLPPKYNPMQAACHVSDVSATINAESSDTIRVNLQAEDAGGNPIEEAGWFGFYLSDDSLGQTLASAPSGGIAAGTDGQVFEYTNNLAGIIVTEADGDADIDIVHSGADTVYLNCMLPTGKLRTIGPIVFGA